jgi:hypothetical protein
MPIRTRGGLTPSFIESGVDSFNSLDLLLSPYAPLPQVKTLADHIQMLQRARRVAMGSLIKGREQSAKAHNNRSAKHDFVIGDRVWVWHPNVAQGDAEKLANMMHGP